MLDDKKHDKKKVQRGHGVYTRKDKKGNIIYSYSETSIKI